MTGNTGRNLQRSVPITAGNAIATAGQQATGWSVQFADSVNGETVTAYVICGA